MRASAFFGLVATALALVWLASRYDFSDVSASMAAAEPLLLAAAVPFLVLSLAFRTARWRLLFGDARPPGWRNSFAALAAGYLFNNLLPSHAGQLVRSFLLGRKEGMAQSRVLGTVVLEKVFDLAVFVGLALVTVAARPVPDWLRQGAITLLMLGSVAVAFMVFAPGFIASMAARLAPLLAPLGATMADRVRSVLESLASGLNGLRRPGVLARIALITTLIWASEIALLSVVVAAFSLDLALIDRLLVLVLIATGTLIPAAPGYVGTYEAFGVLAFDFLQQPHNVSLACVVVLHAIQLAGTCTLGLIGLVWLRESLEIRSIVRLSGAQAPAGNHAPKGPGPRPLLVGVILAWIAVITAVYLVLSGPPQLIGRLQGASPAFTEVRAALASLFHRDYRY